MQSPEESKRRSIRYKAIVSLLTGWSFLIASITGIVLYIQPHGRVAYWTEWRLLGLGKDQWDGIHTITGLVFLVVGAFHIYFNWKPLIGYIRTKLEQGMRLRKEFAIATAVMILFVVGGLTQVPPFGYVFDLNDYIKSSWVKKPEEKPPYGHAEMHSLKSFCSKMNIDLAHAQAELKKEGVEVLSPKDTLKAIANRNRLRPADVYRIIKAHETVE